MLPERRGRNTGSLARVFRLWCREGYPSVAQQTPSVEETGLRVLRDEGGLSLQNNAHKTRVLNRE